MTTLGTLLAEVTSVIAPSLGAMASGKAILAQLKRCAFGGRDSVEDAGPWVPWTLVLQDRAAELVFPGCDHADDPDVRVRAVMSLMDRLPYQIKVFQIAPELAPPQLAQARPWHIRLAEQAGRGIGSLTFAGPVLLATHMATCFPAGHWQDKRVLELGAGAGLLALFVAAHGGRVTVTDRFEYMNLLTLNVELNAELIGKTGGSVNPQVLSWGVTDLSVRGAERGALCTHCSG